MLIFSFSVTIPVPEIITSFFQNPILDAFRVIYNMHLKNISKLTNTLKKKNVLVQVFAINKLVYAYPAQ